MLRAIPALLVLSSLFWGAPQEKRNKSRGTQITIVQIHAQRISEGKMTVEGKVRNDGEQPIKGLLLLLTVYAPGNVPLTTLKGPIESPLLEGGEEAEFRLEAAAPARGVEMLVEAEDKDKRDIRVVGDKRYPIE